MNIHDAKTNLSRYLAELQPVEVLVICNRNRPVAELRSLRGKAVLRPRIGPTELWANNPQAAGKTEDTWALGNTALCIVAKSSSHRLLRRTHVTTTAGFTGTRGGSEGKNGNSPWHSRVPVS